MVSRGKHRDSVRCAKLYLRHGNPSEAHGVLTRTNYYAQLDQDRHQVEYWQMLSIAAFLLGDEAEGAAAMERAGGSNDAYITLFVECLVAYAARPLPLGFIFGKWRRTWKKRVLESNKQRLVALSKQQYGGDGQYLGDYFEQMCPV